MRGAETVMVLRLSRLCRAAVALLALAAVVVLLVISPARAAAENSLTLSGDDAALEAARSLSEAGVFTDWDEAEGVRQEYISRGELALMMAQALGLDDSGTEYFDDVPSSVACFGAVGALHEAGLVTSPTEATFAPEETISRRWAVPWIMEALAYRVSEEPGTNVPIRLSYYEPASSWLAGFKDRTLLGASCARAVANACRLGVIDGTYDGWFYPGLPLSWGDAVVMLDRAFSGTPEVQASYPERSPASADYSDLGVGSSGPLVLYLQYRLSELKYFVGEVDGEYGRHTRDAVIAFHKVERMKRTGTVDEETWARLAAAQTPTPKLSDAGTRVEVDLTRQVLFMITDDQVWKIVHVSTGRLGTRTGHFAIGAKYKGNVSCVTVNGVMYYPSYVVSRTAIHGYTSVPTYPASHGCIRLPMWTAEQLWYEMPSGMTVDVYYNK